MAGTPRERGARIIGAMQQDLERGGRVRPTRRALGLVAIVLVAAACGGPPVPPPAKNLVLISLDTLRADRLGCYGYDRPTTPELDRFAAAGARFREASAPSPWTKPSHASLFSGLYPHRNGVLGFEYPLSKDVPHIAELLRARGFQTGAVVSNSVLTLHGLERGFEHFEFVERPKGPAPSAVTEHALAWLGARDRARPFFAFVHYNDAHADYESLPEAQAEFVRPYQGIANGKARQLFAHALGLVRLAPEDGRHLSDLYDAGVHQLDRQLAPLFAYLEREGLYQDTLVVVTSDHGEEFLEHGGVQHGLAQYEESVRVPLLVRAPGYPSGLALDGAVSLVDVLPTCLELLGTAVPSALDGVSLRARLLGAEPPREPRALYYEADCAVPDLEESAVLQPGSTRAIRVGAFKLHHELDSGETRLYDLARDPGETVDVRGQRPELADALLGDLLRFLRQDARSVTPLALTPEEIERLRELGYAGD